MKSDEKNEMSYAEMSKMRWEKKEEIATKLESLQLDLEDYLEILKKTGGGTTGHAIGSMIGRIKEKTVFFKNYC
jgi:hypothetical protein